MGNRYEVTLIDDEHFLYTEHVDYRPRDAGETHAHYLTGVGRAGVGQLLLHGTVGRSVRIEHDTGPEDRAHVAAYWRSTAGREVARPKMADPRYQTDAFYKKRR